MAHKIQKEFCLSVLEKLPEHFKNQRVLDIGSVDINGNNRYLFTDCDILGIDLMMGPNVDLVCAANELQFRDGYFDIICSTEHYEHDPNWQDSLRNTVRMLRSGGLYLMTCATTGRPEHGTRRSKPEQSLISVLEIDYYMNLTEEDFRSVVNIDEVFKEYAFSTKAQDLYFYGIKR